jgi:hypothetical protein
MNAHTFAFQSPYNIPLASVNYQDGIKTTSNTISVRGETDQEEKTVRAMTSSAPNKMSSERYVICPGENPSSGAVVLVHMLAVQFSARLFGSLNAGYCLSISVLAMWKGLIIPRDRFISCQHGHELGAD